MPAKAPPPTPQTKAKPLAARDPPGPAPASAATRATVPPTTQGAGERAAEEGAQEAGDQHHAAPALPGVSLSPPGVVPESDVRLHSPSAATPPVHRRDADDLGELPLGYGDGRLVALIRDPATVYVYWDFSAQQVDQAFAGLGAARAMVKLWNARHGAGELVREAEVQLEARGWYLRDLPAGTELRVELWAVGERGARMLRAARPIRLPPALPSDQLEAFYIRLDLNQPLPKDGIAGKRALEYVGGDPVEWDRRLEPRHLSSHSSGSMPWSATVRAEPQQEGASARGSSDLSATRKGEP